jgi:hypothetical protein
LRFVTVAFSPCRELKSSYKKACIVDNNRRCYLSRAACGADDDRAQL